MKNKSLPLIIGIILILALAGGAFLFLGNKSPSQDPSSMSKDGIVTEDGSVQSNLKNLLMGGAAQKCTFTDNLKDSDSSGTVYMAGGKMRGEFNTAVDGQSYASNMIMMDNKVYTWQEGQKTGFMMEYDPKNADAGNATPQSGPDKTFDPEKVVDYKCSSWSADNSLFNPPSDVKFTDYSTMMQPPVNAESTGSVMQNPCAACDSLTGDARSQCLVAAKCI